MPLPAIIGLPALISFIVGIVSSVFTWLLQRFTFKLAVFLAALTAISAALNAFFTLMSGYVGQLVQTAPAGFQEAAYFLPANTGLCISLILGAEVASAVYSLTFKVIKLKVEAA